MVKIFTIISLVFSLMVISCKNETTGSKFNIQGHVKGLSGSKIYLKKYTGSGYSTIDSAIVADGKFCFTGSVNLPELYRIALANSDQYIPVFVENANISIQANIDKIDSATVSGSASHDLLKHFWASLDSIDNAAKPLYDAYNSAKKTSDSKKIAVLEERIDSVSKIQNIYIKDFIKSHKSSIVSVFVLYKYLSVELEFGELVSLSNSLDTVLRKSVYTGFLKDQIEIMKKTQVGMPAIDFVLSDTSGTELRLSSLYGKYILIDFWASWCSSCRQENPNVVAAFKKFKSKGFTVLGVSFDTKRANWTKAIRDDKLEWNHVSDLQGWNNAVGKLYGIRAIPSNLLLDTKGMIIAKNLRGHELQKKLAALLK
jgi:peroxiredoxin